MNAGDLYTLVRAIPAAPLPGVETGTMITVVKLQRDYVTVGDILAARRAGKQDDLGHDIMLIARLFHLDPSEVESLDLRDFYPLQEAATEVFASSRPEEPEEVREGEHSPKG